MADGKAKLADLCKELGIEDTVPPPQKRLKADTTKTHEFNPEVDNFNFSTACSRVILTVADVIRGNNIDGNFTFNDTGIKIWSLPSAQTVCIIVRLGPNMFSEFTCSKEVCTTINLNVFFQKIWTLQKMKAQKLTFRNAGQDLELVGYSDNQPKSVICLKPLDNADEDVDGIAAMKYPVLVQLNAAELNRLIDGMPTVFTISIDFDDGCLVFTGVEDSSTTKLAMRLEENVIDTLHNCKASKGYRASFLKSSLACLTKAAKLSDCVNVGFVNDAPLFLQYTINESSDFKKERESNITIYVSAKINDDEEYE